MKKVIIYWLGISGRAMYELLKSECDIYLYDDRKEMPNWAIGKKFLQNKIPVELPEGIDALLLSPSIKSDSPLIVECKKRKISVMGELELGYLRSKCKIVAVTGTNGKTTTVSLINHILRESGRNSYALGNIGKPFCSMCDILGEDDIAVLEVSSFQLESCNFFAPYICAMLNITPDHLDWHGDFLSYIKAKEKLFDLQQEGFSVINADDPIVNAIEWREKTTKLYFSLKKKINGCYLKKGKIIIDVHGVKEVVCHTSKMKLRGEHNIQNVMCALLVCYSLGVKIDDLKRGLQTFSGSEHRLESVGQIRGVEFVNDSKSTNIDSTQKAIKSFKNNIFLILGGKDKNLDFDSLFEKISKRVKKIAIIGEASLKISAAAKKNRFKKYLICSGLEEATKSLFAEASSGDVVLLSPACSSFDEYDNYAERGRHFKNIVEKLKYEVI